MTTTSERVQPPIELGQGAGTGGGGGAKRPTGRERTMGILIVLLALALTGVVVRSTPATSAPSAFRPAEASGKIVDVHLTAVETQQTIVQQGAGVDSVRYDVWTFDGTAPGPVVRVHLGDTVRFTLHNASTMGMQHSIDFHAAMTPWANLPAEGSSTLTGNYQPVNPGETKTFDWVAMYPGVFMYHCGTPPVIQHIANGMYGAIVVEPDTIPVEREYVLVNSEFYPSAKPTHGAYVGDLDAMNAGTPTYVVWNGVADQYKTTPLVARPDEPFRLWVVNAGPTLTSAFHVIGTMFDAYADGNPVNVVRGDQTYNIPPGGAAMFELRIPDPGLYPFLTHAFAYAGRGSIGVIKIDPNAPDAPSSYPALGDPFSAGVQPFVPPASVADVVAAAGAAPSAAVAPSPAMTMPMQSGSGSPTQTGSASPAVAMCAPQGTKLRLSATASAFDATCLAAPAGSTFTIAFTNNDAGVPHNLSIYTDASATTALFTGELVTGPDSIEYQVPALDAGTYYFRCDVHPTQMFGTFVVE